MISLYFIYVNYFMGYLRDGDGNDGVIGGSIIVKQYYLLILFMS